MLVTELKSQVKKHYNREMVGAVLIDEMILKIELSNLIMYRIEDARKA